MRLCLMGLVLAASCLVALGQENPELKPCSRPIDECLNAQLKAYRNTSWDGLRVDGVGGPSPVRVVEIEPESPALAAGFKVDDILVEMDGDPMRNWSYEDLLDSMRRVEVGHVVTYLVQRGDRRFELQVTLASPPETLIATWIGFHFIKHHAKHESEPQN